MENLSANNRNSLMEAYASIYSDDHIGILSEEQTLNEFYEDINSLLREGYDLSDYTYDELYEVYVAENRLSGILNLLKGAAKSIGPNLKKTAQYSRDKFRSGLNVPPGKTSRSTIAKDIFGKGAGAAGKITRFSLNNPFKAAGIGLALHDLTKGDRSLIGKAANLGGQAISGITGAAQGIGRAASGLDRAVYGGGGSTSSSGRPPTEGIQLPAGYRLVNGNVVKVQEDYDLFDVIMNHLLYEGYTDSEEGALAIMANMSEEWIENIVEDGYVGLYDQPQTTHRRVLSKDPKALMSPGRRMIQRAHELETQKGPKDPQAKKQRQRAGLVGKHFTSAERARRA